MDDFQSDVIFLDGKLDWMMRELIGIEFLAQRKRLYPPGEVVLFVASYNMHGRTVDLFYVQSTRH